jgi:hypothetical protein
VVGVSGGGFGPFGPPNGSAGAPPTRDYDFEGSAEEVPPQGNGERRLPRSDEG